MPLDFPASPSVNDTYTYQGRTWKWNGTGWQLESPLVGTSSIQDLAVTTAKIADNAITSGKIADGAVAPADLSTGGPSWDSSGNQTVTGDVTLSGTGKRIKADFSNGTISNRVSFQTTGTNTSTIVNALPSGSGTAAGYLATNNATPTNAGYGALLAGSASVTLESGRYGSGTYLPLELFTGGSARVHVDTSGNVGIGNTSPTAPLSFAETAGTAGAINKVALFSASGTATYGFGVSSNQLDYVSGNNHVFWQRVSGTPTERARFTSDAYLRMASGTGGIQFGGDTAAANALNDYEEGTWTPGVGGNATYALQRGSYTKVGRLITVNFDMNINTLGTGSTTTITLPFSSGIGSGNGGCSGVVRWWQSLAVSATALACYIESTGTSLQFVLQDASDNANQVGTAAALFQSGARVAGTITYMT
jgi:hypothetical protein